MCEIELGEKYRRDCYYFYEEFFRGRTHLVCTRYCDTTFSCKECEHYLSQLDAERIIGNSLNKW